MGLRLLLLAVSHRVAICGREFEAIPLPAWAVARADALRASERFFWPVLYAALFGAAVALVRRIGGRRAAGVLFAALMAVLGFLIAWDAWWARAR